MRTVLYIGVTNDLERRMFEHKGRFNQASFTAQYNCDKLVYYEEYNNIADAISREKRLKRYPVRWKVDLINEMNREWLDLAEKWFNDSEFKMYRKFDKE